MSRWGVLRTAPGRGHALRARVPCQIIVISGPRLPPPPREPAVSCLTQVHALPDTAPAEWSGRRPLSWDLGRPSRPP